MGRFIWRAIKLVTRASSGKKTVRPDMLANDDWQQGEAISRFEREAHAAASIRHPNVGLSRDFWQNLRSCLFFRNGIVEGVKLFITFAPGRHA